MLGYKISNQEGIYFVTFAVVEWVDVFTRKQYAEIVIESLKYSQKEKGLIVYACCLMSNHIHLIISSDKGELLAVLRDFKKFISSQIIKNSNNKKYQFWRQNNQPKELISNDFKDEKLNYLPVLSGGYSHESCRMRTCGRT